VPIVVTCPSCKAKLKAPDGLVGKQVKCPGCQTAILVTGPAATTPAPKVQSSPAVKKKAPPVDYDDDMEVEDAPPPRSKKSSRDDDDYDDEDDRPRKAKKSSRDDDYDDEDDRPRKAKKSSRDDDDYDDDEDDRPSKAKKSTRDDDDYDDDEDNRPRKGKKKGGVVPRGRVTEEDKKNAFNMYLFSIIANLIGLPGVLVFLVMWLMKRKESPLVDWHGKQFLNFNITAFLIMLGLLLVFGGGAVLGFAVLQNFWVGFASMGLLFLCAFVLGISGFIIMIMAMLKAKAGEFYRYPMAVQFLK
jgi:uncharacterized Tic20 family protein